MTINMTIIMAEATMDGGIIIGVTKTAMAIVAITTTGTNIGSA